MKEKQPELARLYRPVDSSFFPQHGIIASLDRKNNIVFYDKDVFEELSEYDRRKIYQLDDAFLTVRYT